MVKELEYPKRSCSARRIRTHAEWKVEIHIPVAASPINPLMRSRISPAALLVKVMARIWLGHASRVCSKPAIRLVKTLVFPEPAPATIKRAGPRYSTASACRGFNPSTKGDGESDIAGSV